MARPYRGYNCPTRAVSSVGRAPARQAGGHWFEPSTAHLERRWKQRLFSCSGSLSAAPQRGYGKTLGKHLRGIRSSRQGGRVNSNGHPQTLVPAEPGNTLGVRHGVYSRSGRVLAARAEEIADALMHLPYAHPLDVLAAEEIGSLMATLEAVDAALSDGRVENKRGQVRHLLDVKARLSRQLREWLAAFGATPAARADWAAKLARPSFAEQVEQRRKELENRGND
jgi:hypothetical protein